MRRADLVLVLLAVAGGALCFASLGRLWPLADVDLFAQRAPPSAAERAVVAASGLDPDRDARGARLRVEEAALDWLDEAFGRERAQRWLRDGLPAVVVRATWKRAGDADGLTVTLHPDGRVLGWARGVQEDAPGAHLDDAAALASARVALARLGVDADAYALTQRATLTRPARRDHQLAFERRWSQDPDLRERVEVLVAGDRVAKAVRSIVVPAAYERARRAREASVEGLQSIGLVGLSVAALCALGVFFTRLARGEARLGRAAALAGIVGLLVVVDDLCQQAALHEQWDPLWPRWIAFAKLLVDWNLDTVALVVSLLAFVAAGDALDRAPRPGAALGAGRGATLWALARGRFTEPGVIAASLRGFLIGLVCGGVLAGSVLLAQGTLGARTALQPRGFFLHPLNSAAPAATTLAFFLYIALLEELGYRFFAGTWLERLTGRRWLAIALPAAVYGLMHSALGFLPPAEPSWARPLALALVGSVWGVAFFRYDALTVVLSHWACDLFIFTWPSLGSGDPARVAGAIALTAAPLAPAAIGMIARAARRRGATTAA